MLKLRMILTFDKNQYGCIAQLKRLWLEAFNEKAEAAELFFERCLSFTSFYTASRDGEPVSMLFLVHGMLDGSKAHYLCCAATARNCRGMGIMSRLIEYALEDARKNGEAYSLLFPASERLYGYYERFGYKPLSATRSKAFSREELMQFAEKNDSLISPDNSYDYEELQRLSLKNNFLLQNNDFISFASEYYSLYDCKAVKSDECFALLEEENGNADVFYSLYTDFSSLAQILLENTAAKRFVFTGKSDDELYKNSENKKYGMIKSLDDNEKTPENVYIGITLN